MAAPAMVPRPQPCSVIVIDDSPGDLYWFKMVAEEIGFHCEVRAYPYVAAAIQDLKKNPPGATTAVFMSAILPLLSLDEACCELRSIPGFAAVPMVAMVDGFNESELAARAGVQYSINKPVDGTGLRDLVER